MSGPRLYASYDNSKIDILACVAIDIRRVAYFPVFGKFQSAIHLFESGVDSYLRGSKAERRRIDEYPIAAALQGATGGLVARQ